MAGALTSKGYDTVHIQGHLPMFFLFIPYLKLKHKKICWTLHDISLRASSAGIRGKIELLYFRGVTQPGLLRKHADVIIVHGNALKNQLISIGIPETKINIIPIFDYRYLLTNTKAWSLNNFVASEQYVLFFGRLVPYKGIDVLVRAAKIVWKRVGTQHDHFRVLIAGKGDTSFFADLISTDDYKYICIRNEFIPNEEVGELFSKAKFVVMPYSEASQSAVVPLAYTFSKPVIVSNAGSMREYVEHGITGFVFETGNAEQLAEYMIRLLQDKDERLEMGKRAYDKLLADMSIEKCCAKINTLYENAHAGPV